MEAEGSDADSDSAKKLGFMQMLKTDPKEEKEKLRAEKAERAEKKRRQQATKEGEAPGLRRDSDSYGKEIITLYRALDETPKPETPKPTTAKPASGHARRSSMTTNPVVRALAKTPVGGLLRGQPNSPRNTGDSPRPGASVQKLRRRATENEKMPDRDKSTVGEAVRMASSPRGIAPSGKKASPQIKLSDSEAKEFLERALEQRLRDMRQSTAKKGESRLKQSGPQAMFRGNETISWKGKECTLMVLSDHLHQFFARGPVAEAFQKCIEKLTEVDQDPYGEAQSWITSDKGKLALVRNKDTQALLAIVIDSVRGKSHTLESSQLPQPVKEFLSYMDERLSVLCEKYKMPPDMTEALRHNALSGLLVIRGMSKLFDLISRNNNADNKDLWSRFAAALLKELNDSEQFFQSIMNSTDARLEQAQKQTSGITTGNAPSNAAGTTAGNAVNAAHGADDEYARTQAQAQVRSKMRLLWAEVATLDATQLGFMRAQLDTMLTILDHPLLLNQAESIAAVFQERIAALVANAVPARHRASPVSPRSLPVPPVPPSNQSALELPKVSRSTTSSSNVDSDISSSTDA